MIKLVLAAAAIFLAWPAGAETRLALVITNAAYPSEIGALANPHKDGEVIATGLAAVGFEKNNIAIVRDADQPALRIALADFVERIERAGPDAVAFLYYSGHGAADRTDRGENYLIPIGAKIALAKQLPILGVSLSEIARSLERAPAKARFIVVDACRDVAFTKGLKDSAKGLVPERKLDGMIVAFATRPGETADDNNIYASALASILPTPGLEAEQVFKETQRRVADLSKGRQIPWTEDGLLTRFKFKEAAPDAEIELAVWTLAKAEGTLGALESYLQRYPHGTHSGTAKLLIEKIRQEEASRAALQKKAEEEAQAKRQQEERVAAEKRAAEERAHQEAEAKRQAAVEAAKKKAEEEALAKRQREERIAAERREAEERARGEAEAKRQAAAEAAKRKAEEEAQARRQQEERIVAEKRAAEERARQEVEAKRQAAAEAAKKKSEEEAQAKRQQEERIAAERHEVDWAADDAKKVASLPQGPEVKLPGGPVSDPVTLARSLQAALKRVGCDPGAVDGQWGAKAKEALREFNQAAKATLSSELPTEDALRTVGAKNGRVCALSCNPNEEEKDGRCVARANTDRTRAGAKEEQRGTTSKETGTTKLCWTNPGFTVRPCTGHPWDRPAN